MTANILEAEAQRGRWARYRERQRLSVEFGDEFARGGLGRHVHNLDLRLIFLPADPEAAVMEWLRQRRSGHGVLPSHRERATAQALVSYEQRREDRGWDAYVAVLEHGGIELGAGISYTVSELRVFSLLGAVAMSAAIARMQAEAADRWQVQFPYELLIALRNARGATLGGFAEGWPEPGQGLFGYETCLDEHVMIRRELHESIDPEGVAIEVGDHLERAFGATSQRHFARGGRHQGQLDPNVL